MGPPDGLQEVLGSPKTGRKVWCIRGCTRAKAQGSPRGPPGGLGTEAVSPVDELLASVYRSCRGASGLPSLG